MSWRRLANSDATGDGARRAVPAEVSLGRGAGVRQVGARAQKPTTRMLPSPRCSSARPSPQFSLYLAHLWQTQTAVVQTVKLRRGAHRGVRHVQTHAQRVAAHHRQSVARQDVACRRVERAAARHEGCGVGAGVGLQEELAGREIKAPACGRMESVQVPGSVV